jgi:hypothetical protein
MWAMSAGSSVGCTSANGASGNTPTPPNNQRSGGSCQQGDASIKAAVEKRLAQAKAPAEIAGLEVCLALLGDPKYIKREHFKLDSGSIGFAALEAIDIHKDKEGVMDILVAGGMDHHWGSVREEAVFLFERITGQSWTKKNPHVQPYSFSVNAKEWWQANGKEFMKKRLSP